MVVIPGIALASYRGLLFFLKKTLWGKQTVALTHHREMATALGVDVKKVATLVFVLGAVLGALGGALAVPVSALSPGVGAEMIVLSFTVVASAGLGQITGALITALMIGLARSYGSLCLA
jgi:branched-chain amino acid transport system permease protein